MMSDPHLDNLIDLTKKMIKMPNDEGWRAMARTIITDPSYKQTCITALSEIAGKRQLIINQKFTKLSDLFIEKLEYNIALIEVTEK